ncbi:MAG: glycosyltransferase [Ignavibacteria bacterium]|nr:glycosyltransferase [Ignavibacteria bacterium]
MVKFSIIIPTLNEEKLLEKLLSQITDEIKSTFQLEIIVSDGGSTDSTISIAKKYSDVIVQKEIIENENIAIGRNRGAKIANGEILVFLNADTQFQNAKEFFREVIFIFEKQNIVGITCSVYVVPKEELFGDRIIHFVINHWFWFLNLVGIGMGRGECHVVKKEIFQQLHGYNERMSAGEDFEFFTRLKNKGELKFLRNIVVYESPRRYRKYGYMKVLFQWFLNAMYGVLFRKSYSTKWGIIR